MIINNKNKNKKSGFSLVEMMLLLMIASLITAGSMSVITKKHSRVPKKIVHGKYTCYYTSEGKLFEERYVENSRIYKREVEKCVFEPPAKATYFYIQLVGGGGSGGDAGYRGNTRSTVNDSGSKTPFGWSESEVTGSPFYMTVAEWRSIINGDTVYVSTYAGDGGDGSPAGKNVKQSTGKCTCGSSVTDGVTSETCSGMSTETLSCSWAAELKDEIVWGGDGGDGPYCSTASVAVDFGLSETHSYGSSGSSYGSTYYANENRDGGDGSSGSASISQNGTVVASCTAYGGTGGTHATQDGPWENGFNYGATAGTDGDDGYCSGGSCSSSGTSGYHGPSYSWSHEYQTKYLTAGEGGGAGEYIAMFVRSFRTNKIDLKPGKGGAAPALGSGDNGNDGEETSISNRSIVVPGGLGGKGNQPLPIESLPPNTPTEASGYNSGKGTHTGISPNYYGSFSSYERAANMTNMNDVPPAEGEGIDLNTFGRGGNGGQSQDNCWIGKHIRKFAGTTLNSTFPASKVTCSDNDYVNIAATAGAPGSIVIVW